MDTIYYHINPATGVPSICRAKPGNCPYGGESGNANHFRSYSSAQAFAQKMLEEKYEVLPIQSVNELLSDKDISEAYSSMIEFESEYLPKDDYEAEKLIRTTSNTKVIMGVIEGDIYVENGYSKIAPALQNPNLPRDFIDKVFSNPSSYTPEFQNWLMTNPSLTEKDLLYVVDRFNNENAKRLALMHSSIASETAMDIIADMTASHTLENEDLLRIALINNSNFDEDGEISSYRIECIMDDIDTVDPRIDLLKEKYQDWLVVNKC